VFNTLTAPLQSSGKASHKEQGDPAADVCAALLSRKDWGCCRVQHIHVCPVRAEAEAEPGRENCLTLPVHKRLRELPPAGFCGCLEERGESSWGLCLAMLACAC